MEDVIKNIKLGETSYPVVDSTARADASEALNTANTAKSTADTAKSTADTALSTANSKVAASYESDTNTLVLS